MEGNERAGVVIKGEQLDLTDEVAFLIADDIVRALPDELPPGGRDRRQAEDADRVDQRRRFGGISLVCSRLDELGDPEWRLEWLVKPNAVLAGQRPIDAISSGRLGTVLEVVDHLSPPAARPG